MKKFEKEVWKMGKITRFRETLGKLLLRKAYDLSFLIKQNTAVARCAGIKCHDVFSHV